MHEAAVQSADRFFAMFVQAFSHAAGEIATQFAGRIAYYGVWNEPDAVARISGGE